MIKLYGLILFVFILCAMVNVAIEGGSGIAQTQLNGALSASATTVPVDSVSGFLAQDILYIDNEIIWYDNVSAAGNTFGTSTDVVTRGYAGSTAAAHSDNAIVRGSDANAINKLVGYNVSEATSVIGTLGVPFMLVGAVTQAVAKIIIWDFAALSSGAGLYIKYIAFWPLSGMVVVGFITLLASLLMGIFGAFRP